ncbi:MAG: type I glutamate--ammonia ligase [Desulfurococcales archaeon]|nr:type I glutamate--ammonia ligase [Desulfurococcales archaeon]
MTPGIPSKGKILFVHYTDLAGFLRQVEVPYENIEDRFVAAFDGSSVAGIAPIEKSDMLLEAVKDTLKPVPWHEGVWRVIARIYRPDGSRNTLDPRLAAERATEYSATLGYKPVMGTEVEFFLFSKVDVEALAYHRGLGYRIASPEQPEESPGIHTLVKLSYHYTEPADKIAPYRVELVKTMEEFGYKINATHHEVAVSQMEASIGPFDPAGLGDAFITLKWVARVVASRMGLVANFMPKPIYGDNGSGMHVHVSLWDERGNAFYSPDSGISEVARHFIAGVMEHARSLAALTSPTTNSYRRLVPGYEAPVYVAWGYYNRSAFIRVPSNKGNPKATRIEVRSPDPSANGYLAFAAVVMAGLDGVKKKLEPPDPYEGNLYKLDKGKLRELGIKVLPKSLDEALDELESDNEYLKPAFSKELLETYIDVKREEAEKVRLYPHPIEFYYYMPL